MADLKLKANAAKLASKMAEQVLVVPRTIISALLPAKGIAIVNESSIKSLIEHNASFLPREQAETDLGFKQIIPYLVFCHEEQVFLMQRSCQASEQRLANKLSLGIGGHLKAKDLAGQNMFSWAKREFLEEVSFAGNIEQQFIGLINDDSELVGQVHTGLLWLVNADNGKIAIKDEHVSGKMVSLAECQINYDKLESWSQLIVDYLLASQ